MNMLVFATNNLHKLEEIKKIVSSKIQIRSLADAGIFCQEDIPETASTLEENALMKAHFIKENYGYDCFADDTGLEVEALNNAPGVRSARYAGKSRNSQANIAKLLKKMKKINNRKARFRTVIALTLDGRDYLFEGIINGSIIKEERGTAGFGYDPIFVPSGYMQTFAELGNNVKNTISHRALAGKKLATFLSTYNHKV
jgi:XTP/dITP diphosphohydrolase